MLPDNQLFRGRFHNVHDRRPTSVRIFISSTFSGEILFSNQNIEKKLIFHSLTDTIEERDELMKNVYPKLRDYCLQTYNIQFQVYYLTDTTKYD
jgi:hypothetical protein